MNFPTIEDVKKLMTEEEKSREEKIEQNMKFLINKGLSEKERIKDVSDDIAIEYPEIPEDLREKIASMEEPICGCHEDYEWFYKDELRVCRLYNIINVTYSEKELFFVFEKAYQDIKQSYTAFLNHFTYANPGASIASNIMRILKNQFNDDEIRIPKY